MWPSGGMTRRLTILKSTAEIGSELYPVSWNGAVWRFATRAEADMFAANPDQFAPQFGAIARAHCRSRNWSRPIRKSGAFTAINSICLPARLEEPTLTKGPDAMIAKAVEYWASL